MRFNMAEVKSEKENKLFVKSLVASGNILFRKGFFVKAKSVYQKSIQSGKYYYSPKFSASLRYNIRLCEKQNEYDFESRPKIILMLDCTRLFTQNLKTGITRYNIKLLEYLIHEGKILVVPFFIKKRPGFIPQKVENETYVFEYEDKLYDIMSYENALKIVKSIGKPIIYHSPYYPIPESRDPKIKYCLTVHDIFHLTHPEFYPDGNNSITKKIINSIDTEKDEILVVSRFTGNELKKYLNKQMSITFTPLTGFLNSNTEFETNLKKKNLLVPFQNDPRKGFDRMLNVALKWMKLEDDFFLTIFGKTDMLNDAERKKIYETEGLTERIMLVHLPNDEELKKLYQESFAFLFFSSLEGFGMPPLEAMQYNCLPILFTNSSLAEIYHGWKYIFDESVSDDFIINQIFAAQKEPLEYSKKLCKEILNRYSWELCFSTHIAAYLNHIDC